MLYDDIETMMNRMREFERIFNPCGHSLAESNICDICGYPDPRKLIAKLRAFWEYSRLNFTEQWEKYEWPKHPDFAGIPYKDQPTTLKGEGQ